MSDRIVIINKGMIEQIDTPENIYRHPSSIFVADFIGEANILDTKVLESNSSYTKLSIINDYEIKLSHVFNLSKDDGLKLVVRPENVNVYRNLRKDTISGVITDITYNGDCTVLTISISDNFNINAKVIDECLYKENDKVYIDFDENFIVPLRR